MGKDRYKVHFIIAVVSLLLLLVIVFLSTTRIFTFAFNVAEIEKSLNYKKEEIIQINKTEKEMESLEKDLKELESFYFADTDVPLILNSLEILALEYNLVVSVNYLEDSSRAESISATIFVFGDFQDIYNFFNQIFNLPYLLSLNSFEMEYGDLPKKYIKDNESEKKGWGANIVLSIDGYKDYQPVSETE